MLRALHAGSFLHLGLFIITTVPFRQLCEGVCDQQFPPQITNSEPWKPRLAFEAAFAGNPTIDLPHIGSGFNRTLNIDGFCNNVLWKSSAFTCSANAEKIHEFKATPTTKENGVKISFDDANCPLSGVSVRKTRPGEGAPFEAEIRFQFEWCKAQTGAAAAPVSSAAVVLGLRKQPSLRGVNLLPWMREVCSVPTTPPPTAVGAETSSFVTQLVGPGTCNAAATNKPLTAAESIDSMVKCEHACSAQQLAHQQIPDQEVECTAFAYRDQGQVGGGDNCMLYQGAVNGIHEEASWNCTKLEMKISEISVVTAPPSPIDALSDLTQDLKMMEVTGGALFTMNTAKLMQVTSDENCFAAAWWFILQDDEGNPASIPVLEVEWDELMALLPDPPVEEPKPASAHVYLDRVLTKTCHPDPDPASTILTANVVAGATVLPVESAKGFVTNQKVIVDAGTLNEEVNYVAEVPVVARRLAPAMANNAITLKTPLQRPHKKASILTMPKGGWGRECIMPKTKELCENSQLINAGVTGFVVPVLGWIVMHFFFNRCLPAGCQAYKQEDGSRDVHVYDNGYVPTCKPIGFVVSCIVALLVCGGLAAGTSTAVSYALGAAGCLHGLREMIVVGVATGIPAGVSFILGIMYMQFSGHKHRATGGNSAAPSYVPPKGQKLMLVEVSDDRHPLRGVPLNPDILQTGNSAMSSYNQTNAPREIDINTYAQDLSTFQSGGSGGPFSKIRGE